MIINLLLSFGAGVASFLSPCCLPVYPSYLSYLSGLSTAELESADSERRRRVLQHSVAFVGGFSVIWVALGLGTSALGRLFIDFGDILRWVGGLMMLAMGLVLLGTIRLPFLMRDTRVQITRKPAGYAGSFMLGLAFAAGWTPCIGPILGSVLALALSNPSQGLVLLLAYSAGFAIPFLALAYGVGSARWLLRYSRPVEIIGGTLMIIMGFLLITNRFTLLLGWLIDRFGGFRGF